MHQHFLTSPTQTGAIKHPHLLPASTKHKNITESSKQVWKREPKCGGKGRTTKKSRSSRPLAENPPLVAGRQARFRIMSACGFLLPRVVHEGMLRGAFCAREIVGCLAAPTSLVLGNASYQVRIDRVCPPLLSTRSSSSSKVSEIVAVPSSSMGVSSLSTSPSNFLHTLSPSQYSTHAGQTKARASSTTNWGSCRNRGSQVRPLRKPHVQAHEQSQSQNKRRLPFRP